MKIDPYTIRLALQEDLHPELDFRYEDDLEYGDLSAALVPEDRKVEAIVISREKAVLCGTDYFSEVFRYVGGISELEWKAKEGDQITPNQTVCVIKGNARTILTGERTALNFLQLLSGTATITNEYVQLIKGTKAKLLDTRKTIPGLRVAQKHAVKCGGGYNHRMGLYDAVLIKENHIAAAGSIKQAVSIMQDKFNTRYPDSNTSNASNRDDVLIEVEVENLEELQEAISSGVPRIMLDNFSLENLREGVKLNQTLGGYAKLEASGGINKKTIRDIAETGVDYISVGELTKHVKAVDFSLRLKQ